MRSLLSVFEHTSRASCITWCSQSLCKRQPGFKWTSDVIRSADASVTWYNRPVSAWCKHWYNDVIVHLPDSLGDRSRQTYVVAQSSRKTVALRIGSENYTSVSDRIDFVLTGKQLAQVCLPCGVIQSHFSRGQLASCITWCGWCLNDHRKCDVIRFRKAPCSSSVTYGIIKRRSTVALCRFISWLHSWSPKRVHNCL